MHICRCRLGKSLIGHGNSFPPSYFLPFFTLPPPPSLPLPSQTSPLSPGKVGGGGGGGAISAPCLLFPEEGSSSSSSSCCCLLIPFLLLPFLLPRTLTDLTVALERREQSEPRSQYSVSRKAAGMSESSLGWFSVRQEGRERSIFFLLACSGESDLKFHQEAITLFPPLQKKKKKFAKEKADIKKRKAAKQAQWKKKKKRRLASSSSPGKKSRLYSVLVQFFPREGEE